MEDNNNDIGGLEEETLPERSGTDEEVGRVKYTKQQSFMYTIVSIVLFFVIYFAVKWISGTVNAPYKMSAFGEQISPENTEKIFEISGISPESGYGSENIHLYKDPQGYYFTALFSCGEIEENDEDYGYMSHAEEVLTFEFGSPLEDERIEFCPYENAPYEAEYSYGEQYSGIDEQKLISSVSFFEWENRQYALYEQRGDYVPSEIKSLFSDAEKVY